MKFKNNILELNGYLEHISGMSALTSPFRHFSISLFSVFLSDIVLMLLLLNLQTFKPLNQLRYESKKTYPGVL